MQLGRDGAVLAHSMPFGYGGHPIRRAQALAITNGLGLTIARELIAAKLDGQRQILLRLGADLREHDKLRAAIDAAESIERVRVVEATAAGLYFSAWRDVRIRFRDRDAARVPARWLRADSRASLLTGAPRAATSPLNAMRNYILACCEAEARLALLAHGCDPQMGCLHSDQRNRDSLALDAIEGVRSDVDAFLLDMLEDRVFTARDFAELPTGYAASRRHLPTNSHSRCRIGANACARSQRALRKRSAMRSETEKRRLAFALTRGIRARPLPGRPNHRCSQRLARPRSRGLMQRGNGARQQSKHGQARQPRARCAASRSSSAGADIAMRACPRRGASMASARWKLLARHSPCKARRAMIRAAMPP